MCCYHLKRPEYENMFLVIRQMTPEVRKNRISQKKKKTVSSVKLGAHYTIICSKLHVKVMTICCIVCNPYNVIFCWKSPVVLIQKLNRNQQLF